VTRPFTAFQVLTACATMTLTACQQAESPAPSENETMADAPEAKPGLVASEARLILPAVAGRPGVAYVTLHNGSDKPVEIAAVSIDGVGKAEIHVTESGTMKPVAKVPVEAGGDVTLAPGGLHVMAFDIDPALVPGGASELTMTFTGGDKLSMPITIEAMGSGMAGMNHEDAN
jgi:periplasmic copper chaperone A